MHILIISEGYLTKIGSAGNVVMCGLVEAALKMGHKVKYIGLISETNKRDKKYKLFYTENVKNFSHEIIKYKQENKNRIEKFISNFDKSVKVQYSRIISKN